MNILLVKKSTDRLNIQLVHKDISAELYLFFDLFGSM